MFFSYLRNSIIESSSLVRGFNEFSSKVETSSFATQTQS
jgi:hypothetical protein